MNFSRLAGWTHRVWWSVAAVVLLAGGAGLWGYLADDDGSLHRVRSAGELRIGYAVEWPFVEIGPDGRVGGETAEAAREVARRLGLREVWILTSLDRLIADLNAGRIDVIGAGLFVTPQRAQQVRFTRPTLRERPGWLTRAGEQAPGLGDAVPDPVPRVAVVGGSAAEPVLRATGLGEHLVLVPDVRTGQVAVASGQVQALALPLPAARRLAAERAATFAAWPGQDARPTRGVALAFRLGDARLAAAADDVLQHWVGSPPHRAVLAAVGLSDDDLPVTVGSQAAR